MQTILQILKMAGGWHHGLNLKIENPPYMALVIEATDESGPCGLPCYFCRSLRRTERRPHARPGDVFRAWIEEGRTLTPSIGGTTTPDRAMVTLYQRWSLRLPYRTSQRTRAIRQAVGQQPALAGLRRSLRAATADPKRLTLSRPGADGKARPLHNTQRSATAQGEQP